MSVDAPAAVKLSCLRTGNPLTGSLPGIFTGWVVETGKTPSDCVFWMHVSKRVTGDASAVENRR